MRTSRKSITPVKSLKRKRSVSSSSMKSFNGAKNMKSKYIKIKILGKCNKNAGANKNNIKQVRGSIKKTTYEEDIEEEIYKSLNENSDNNSIINNKKIHPSSNKKNKIIDDEKTFNDKLKEDGEKNNENDALSTQLAVTPEKVDITEKLTNSYIYCREKEREIILNFIKNKDSKNLFLCGQPGTGKTSLVLEIFNNCLQEIEFCFKIHINCMSIFSVKDFYDEVFKFFNKTKNLMTLKTFFSSNNNKKYEELTNILKLPSSKNNNLTKFLKFLNEGNLGKKLTPIILLDEVDQLFQKSNDIIFYDILNVPFISDCNMKIIMISNNSDFDKYIIPKIENRKIKIEKHVFQPYSHIEINKIISQKLQEINYLTNFEENAIRYISSKLANKSGDIRPALEIIKKLILNNKEQFQEGKRIDLKEAMTILSQQYSYFTDIIKDLTFEQKLVVVSIYFLCVNSETNMVAEAEVRDIVN